MADRSTSSRKIGKIRVLFESAVYSSPLQYREVMYLFVMTGITALQLSRAVPMAPCQSLPELMSSQSSQTVKLEGMRERTGLLGFHLRIFCLRGKIVCKACKVFDVPRQILSIISPMYKQPVNY